MLYIGMGIAVFGACVATGYGNSKVIAKAIETMGRQPEMAAQIRSTMIIGVSLIEAVPILGVVVAILMLVLK